MATIKPVQKTATTSFRFSPEFAEVLDQLTTSLGLTRVAAIEAGARLLLDTIRRTTPDQTKKAIEATKESRQAI